MYVLIITSSASQVTIGNCMVVRYFNVCLAQGHIHFGVTKDIHLQSDTLDSSNITDQVRIVHARQFTLSTYIDMGLSKFNIELK